MSNALYVFIYIYIYLIIFQEHLDDQLSYLIQTGNGTHILKLKKNKYVGCSSESFFHFILTIFLEGYENYTKISSLKSEIQ